jgi:MFS superfamily sulfate permease-like transporter
VFLDNDGDEMMMVLGDDVGDDDTHTCVFLSLRLVHVLVFRRHCHFLMVMVVMVVVVTMMIVVLKMVRW